MPETTDVQSIATFVDVFLGEENPEGGTHAIFDAPADDLLRLLAIVDTKLPEPVDALYAAQPDDYDRGSEDGRGHGVAVYAARCGPTVVIAEGWTEPVNQRMRDYFVSHLTDALDHYDSVRDGSQYTRRSVSETPEFLTLSDDNLEPFIEALPYPSIESQVQLSEVVASARSH
jgi:hypothetical protein